MCGQDVMIKLRNSAFKQGCAYGMFWGMIGGLSIMWILFTNVGR